MNNDKNEPAADATPAEEQIASLEQDEIDNVDLTQVSGGAIPKTFTNTGSCCCGGMNPTW